MMDEEERAMRRKKGRGGKSDEESEKMKKFLENEKRKSGSRTHRRPRGLVSFLVFLPFFSNVLLYFFFNITYNAITI